MIKKLSLKLKRKVKRVPENLGVKGTKLCVSNSQKLRRFMTEGKEKDKKPSKSEERPKSWGEGNDRLRTHRDLEEDQT